MLTTTAAEDTVLQSNVYSDDMKVEVANAAGTFVDLSEYAVEARVRVSVDQPIHEARVQFVRASGATKLSPLLATTLDLYREVKIYGSTVAAGDPADFKLLFRGTIDSIAFDSNPIEVVARGRPGALAMDRWVETPTEYGSVAGTAIETVLQNISNDWLDSETIAAPSPPSFNISPVYEQQEMAVWDAFNALAALPGAAMRERLDGAGDMELVLEDPDRTASTADWTFGPGHWMRVEAAELDLDPVRNVVTVWYYDSNGDLQSYTATDPTSISDYGRRFIGFRLGTDSAIKTAAEAQDLADSALADLKEPSVLFRVRARYFWPLEIDDYLGFSAATDLFSSTQKWACTDFEHVLSHGSNRTLIGVRGQPQGLYRQWHGWSQDEPAELGDLEVRLVGAKYVPTPSVGLLRLYLSVEVGRDVESVDYSVNWTSKSDPSDTPSASSAEDDEDLTESGSFIVNDGGLIAGFTPYSYDVTVTLTGYSGAGATGVAGESTTVAIPDPDDEGASKVSKNDGTSEVIIGRGMDLDGSMEAVVSSESVKVQEKSTHAEGNISTSWTPDYNDGRVQSATLTANTTLALPTNIRDGQQMALRIDLNGFTLDFATGYYVDTNLDSENLTDGEAVLSLIRFSSTFVAVGLLQAVKAA